MPPRIAYDEISFLMQGEKKFFTIAPATVGGEKAVITLAPEDAWYVLRFIIFITCQTLNTNFSYIQMIC